MEDPQQAVERADMQRIVREAVEDLADKQRDVVRAYYLEGRSMANLSSLIGCSPEKAEQIKRIGIKALRRNKRLRLLWMEYEAAAFATRNVFRVEKHAYQRRRGGSYAKGTTAQRDSQASS